MIQTLRVVPWALMLLVASATPACNVLSILQSDVDDVPQDDLTPPTDDNNEPDAGTVPPLTQELKAAEGFSIFYPAGWSAAPAANVYQIVSVPAAELPGSDLTRITQIIVFTELRTDHEDAVGRLNDIEAEVPVPSTSLSIDGWPALQRRYVGNRPQPGGAEGGQSGDVIFITTAVAADRLLVRLDATVPIEAPPETADTVEAIGQSLRFE